MAEAETEFRGLAGSIGRNDGIRNQINERRVPIARIMRAGAGVGVGAEDENILWLQRAARRNRLPDFLNNARPNPQDFDAAQRQNRVAGIENNSAGIQIVMHTR